MGSAMLRGWLNLPDCPEVTVVEPTEANRVALKGLPVNVHAELSEVSSDYLPNVVILAIKPQLFGSVLPNYRSYAKPGVLFLSIAAGVSIETMENVLGHGTAVIRCMPNTPAAIGKGVLAYFANAAVTESQVSIVDRLLGSNGSVVRLSDEAQLDAITALSGSGPAYVFHFIEAMTEAGMSVGLPAEMAAKIALKTVEGASLLASEAGRSPTVLREQVTSPGGTTAAALRVLMGEKALSDLVTRAVQAARDRSEELGAASKSAAAEKPIS